VPPPPWLRAWKGLRIAEFILKTFELSTAVDENLILSVMTSAVFLKEVLAWGFVPKPGTWNFQGSLRAAVVMRKGLRTPPENNVPSHPVVK